MTAVTAPPLVGCVVWSPGILACSSFLISVCMFIISKALLLSSATVFVRGGGAIWLNPFATLMFNVCSLEIGSSIGNFEIALLMLR